MSREGRIPVKICGMRDADNIRLVASFLPDYMGFIFYAESPRFVGDDFRIPEDFPSSIRRVGVFVNEDTDKILERAVHVGLDFIQLHGSESIEQCKALRGAGLGVIKVFSIDRDFDFRIAKSYEPVVDFFLFDTKGKHYGGNAMKFDWELLNAYDQEIPFFLSGGISPENVLAVTSLKDMNLHALDVNSGVEDAPGLKSADRMKSLFSKLQEGTIG